MPKDYSKRISESDGEDTPKGVITKAFAWLSSIAACLGIAGTLIGYNSCTTVIHPGEFAVRQINYGSKKGVRPEIIPPGLRREIPGYEHLHVFSRRYQNITLRDPQRGDNENSKYVDYGEEVNIQTSDGFNIEQDVSLLYRITDPFKVLTKFGSVDAYKDNFMKRAEPVFKRTYGLLQPEDFFSPQLRKEKQEEAKGVFNGEFRDSGIEVAEVYIRNLHYHPDVQRKIEDQNLQIQIAELNKVQSAESEALSLLTNIVTLGSQRTNIMMTNTFNYITRMQAEMEAYSRIKRSDADKLTKLAEAEKTKLINQAYQGSGSENLIGLEYAQVLKGLDAIIVPAGISGFNPLNLDSIMKLVSPTNKGEIK